MYEVEFTKSEITVKGPNGFMRVLNPWSVGVVLRVDPDSLYDALTHYTVQYADMTNAEIVAQALGISAYPK